MPQDSLHKRLGGEAGSFSEKEQQLFAHVQASTLDSGLEFCLQKFGVRTSRTSLSDLCRRIADHNSEQLALDKLRQRADRSQRIGKARRAELPSVSRENLELLDARIFELQTALDLLGDDDATLARRKTIEERIEFYSATLARLASAQKGDRDATATETALKLKLREYEDKLNAAKADLTKAISKGGLTPETRAEIEERLKLL